MGKNTAKYIKNVKDDLEAIGAYKRLAERATIYNLITKVFPTGPISIVADTFDFWSVVTEDVKILKPVIMKRDGKVIFRPDSGDPVKIICGYDIKTITVQDIVNEGFDHYEKGVSDDLEYAMYMADLEEYEFFYFENSCYKLDHNSEYGYSKTEPTPEMKGAVECLWEVFGGTTTDKGFKTLDQHVGLIYGDSINLDRAQRILAGLKAKGFSSANIVFGIGSYTYQYVTRDTYGVAVKATYSEVNGKPRNIYKDPKTDDGIKRSAVGLLRVEYENGNYVLYDKQTWEQEEQGCLRPIFQDGTMLVDESIETIRQRLYQPEQLKRSEGINKTFTSNYKKGDYSVKFSCI